MSRHNYVPSNAVCCALIVCEALSRGQDTVSINQYFQTYKHIFLFLLCILTKHNSIILLTVCWGNIEIYLHWRSIFPYIILQRIWKWMMGEFYKWFICWPTCCLHLFSFILLSNLFIGKSNTSWCLRTLKGINQTRSLLVLIVLVNDTPIPPFQCQTGLEADIKDWSITFDFLLRPNSLG